MTRRSTRFAVALLIVLAGATSFAVMPPRGPRKIKRYSWAASAIASFHLVRAASRFSALTGNDDIALPEYALLYETSVDRVARAALLRAEAAALRDEQAAHPDWSEIGRMLSVSYAELPIALSSADAD